MDFDSHAPLSRPRRFTLPEARTPAEARLLALVELERAEARAEQAILSGRYSAARPVDRAILLGLLDEVQEARNRVDDAA